MSRDQLPLIRAARNGERVIAQEVAIPRKGRGCVPILVSAAPIHDRAGRITGAAVAWQDISLRKRAEKRLSQSQKMESVAFLASGVAHTFNNLLTPMIGYANMLRDELPPEKAHMAEMIVQSGERAAELIEQLLAYAGKGQLVVRQVGLSDTVRSLWDLLAASLPERIHLSRDLESDLPPISADPAQIEQIVINLVRNAAEAVPEGRAGLISVSTFARRITPDESVIDELSQGPIPPDNYLCLEVRDDGSGMDQDAISKLFDPFVSTKFAGRGLGLPAAAGIVRSQGGAIEVRSSRGQGSTFRIYFGAGGNSATR